jgi:hypothetical protein
VPTDAPQTPGKPPHTTVTGDTVGLGADRPGDDTSVRPGDDTAVRPGDDTSVRPGDAAPPTGNEDADTQVASHDSLHAPIAQLRADHRELAAQAIYATLRNKMFAIATPAPTLGRYTLLRQLGRGGMGVVHEAEGPTGEHVALKTLRSLSPGGIARLKNEFRGVADLLHPNLVTLHELGHDAMRDEWFVVMELVPGQELGEHLRSVDSAGLRAALGQLVHGVHALHCTGRLHRDLKPSNVLVTPQGRVVVLDFGLVCDADALPEAELAGTPAYMAPEQARGQPATAASDWYSLGVLLREALATRAERLPDLDALAEALLDPEPSRRPDGRAILLSLGLDAEDDDLFGAIPLIGRTAELRALNAAAERPGAPVLALVHGRSGVGKTALIDAFLRARARQPGAVVLRGRCYERESVPYKAIDGLVDALTRHLRTWPAEQLAAALPEDFAALTRVFPVLARLGAPAAGPEVPQDPQETRRRAFRALKQLLAAVARAHPLTLAIDDLQWGDLDSARLVLELLAPPNAPACLLLGSYRREDLAVSPFLTELGRAGFLAVQRIDVPVEPLGPTESEALARALLAARGEPLDAARAAAIARESEGSPLFVEALVRQLHDTSVAAISLDHAVLAAIARLPPLAQDLMALAAVSGQPLARHLLRGAALTADGERAAVHLLHARRLLRSRGAGDDEPVLPYHDRIREVLVHNLAPEALRDLHRRLADVLEHEPEPDSERLAFHWHGAGEQPRAGRHAIVAAERAFAALAFDRAATLFGNALEWSPLAPAQTRALMVRRAEALVYASRCAEAGARYLEVAVVAAPAVGLELRRKAAEQYLISGHLDNGLQVLRPLLRELGLHYPDSAERAVFQLLLGQARIRLRGLEFMPRTVSDPPAATLQLDTCWSVAKGLGFIDPLRAAIFAAENLRLSLAHGDPLRVARALAHHALLDVNQGQPRRATRGAAQIARAHDLALKTGDLQTIGTTTIMRGVADLNAGRWRSALTEVEAGVAILAEHCVGVTWERSIARAMAMHALTMLGEFGDLGPRASAWLREAHDLGDRFASVVAGLYVGHARLAAGDLAGARESVARARATWPREGFHFQHWLALSIEVACDLYSGQGRAAWRRMQAIWPAIERSNLLRMQIPRIDTLMLRAGAAIAAAQDAPDRRTLLRAAGRDARALARESLGHARAYAAVIRAGMATLTGDSAAAVRQLDRAEQIFAASDMPLHAASARWRRALLRGGSRERADAELRARGIADPGAFVATLAPCAVATVPGGDARLSG